MQGSPLLEPHQALDPWRRRGERLRPAPDAGLINQTWLVGPDDEPTAVLQWVNPILDPRIHEDIDAVTTRLAEKGLVTPRLIATADGGQWVPDEEDTGSGCWRLLTYVPGVTLHRLETPQQAAAAGDLVGRFHAAVAGWDYRFRAPRRIIHDTPSRMAELDSALAACDGHPLAAEARRLGATILSGWRAWLRDGWPRSPESPCLPERLCHGDLKISNLRFAHASEGSESTESVGVCLLDLDTLGRQTLAAEMGDAWRSWCNPAGEDDPETLRFDFDLFAASARAWSARLGGLAPTEGESLVPGIERICLELAARFCADAVRNTYFREDRVRFPQAGRHNLVRARSQRELAHRVRAQQEPCRELVRGLSG